MAGRPKRRSLEVALLLALAVLGRSSAREADPPGEPSQDTEPERETLARKTTTHTVHRHRALELQSQGRFPHAIQEARRNSPTADLEEQLEQLHRQKQQAVAEQHFERAAALRDEADRIRKQLPDPPWNVEPADLLLALLQGAPCVGSRIIENLGLHPEQVRAELLRQLGRDTA